MDIGSLPTGTVTFLYTDIEGSTIRWERNPGAMKAAVERHDVLMRQAIAAHGGSVFRIMGDAFCASFPTAPQALSAALAAQKVLYDEVWDPQIAPIRVRMAIHTGVGEVRDGDYVGTSLNRVARLLSTGYGGQTLLSRAAYDLVRYNLPDSLDLRDLGEHHLKDLTQAEHIFQAIAPGLPSDFPPLKTLDNRPNNLPTQPTPLVGRESELVALCALVRRSDTRLVTLTGPGGIGKTRLALQAAADLLDDFEDGAFLVPLAPLLEPGLLSSTVAQSLSLHDVGGKPPLESLKDYLHTKHMLLVLDNFEQIVAGAPVVAELLATCPNVKALVASREVLHIRGEKECAVPPLALPDPTNLPDPEELARYDAVSLFVQRAQDVKPDFQVSTENARALAELCRRLDGLPLAIELAAARIKVLTPQAMLSRLSSRLTLLTGGARDLPERQQTLRNTIAWSYDLLPLPEQLLFRRLSVFSGGFTLEAAEAICGTPDELIDIPHSDFNIPTSGLPSGTVDVLEGLMALADKSLLRQEQYGGSEGRFMMLETIQEFARQMLQESGEVEQMRQRHADFFLALSLKVGPAIMSPGRIAALAHLESEHDNFRAALEWCTLSPERYDMGLHLATNLAMFWDYQTVHISEGGVWLDRMLSLTQGGERNVVRGNALLGAGVLTMALGDYASSRARLSESINICQEVGDISCVTAAMGTLALTYQLSGDPIGAIRLATEALQRIKQAGDAFTGFTIHFTKSIGFGAGALSTFSTLPVEWSIAFLNFILGDAYLAAGDLDTARDRHYRSLELYRAMGVEEDATLPLTSLGKIAMLQGNYDEARSLLEESLAIRRRTNITWYIAITLATLGDLARYQGEYGRAEKLGQESLKIFRDLNNVGGMAWTLYLLGLAALHQSDLPKAAADFKESLRLRREQGNRQKIADNLLGLAEVASAQDNPQKAARLVGAINAILEGGARLDGPEQQMLQELTAAAQAGMNRADYDSAYLEGHEMTVDSIIDLALRSF